MIETNLKNGKYKIKNAEFESETFESKMMTISTLLKCHLTLATEKLLPLVGYVN